jgi:hypothetical protein
MGEAWEWNRVSKGAHPQQTHAADSALRSNACAVRELQ